MPQEIEVWYLLPSVRKELARCFVNDFKLKQKEAADLLGITEAAVSQYLKSKRGTEIKFSKVEKAKIKKAAHSILADRQNVMEYLYSLCSEFRGAPSLCRIHKKYDKNLPKDCKICISK